MTTAAVRKKKGRFGSEDLCNAIERDTEIDVWVILDEVDVDTGRGLDTPLHIAVRSAARNTIWRILVYGADTTRLDKDGYTARQLAMSLGRDDIVRLLDYAQIHDVSSSMADTWEDHQGSHR